MTQATSTNASPTDKHDLAVGTATDSDTGPEPEDPTAESKQPTSSDTRERILDVALDLFIEQGFDGTSLRQIAEKLNVTKAALYYHFESKDDILMALHMRLHALGKDALMQLGDGPVTLEQWSALLDEVLDQLPAQRRIFLLHERNEAAMEKLHREDHDADHMDIQNQFRKVLADTRVPFKDRVRMAASIGVVFSSVFLSGEAFDDGSEEELGGQLREILHEVLAG